MSGYATSDGERQKLSSTLANFVMKDRGRPNDKFDYWALQIEAVVSVKECWDIQRPDLFVSE